MSLEARLAELGARLLTESIEPWVGGRLSAREQDEGEATYCPRLELTGRRTRLAPSGDLSCQERFGPSVDGPMPTQAGRDAR